MPRTPDSFPGLRNDEGIRLYDDGYGQPGNEREIRYSDGYFYAMDAYGVFNLRANVHPHIYTHVGGGTDSFYVVSIVSPTINEDEDDGYEVGWRWINITDGYEFVLIDKSVGAAIWKNTTLVAGGAPDPHASTHIHNGSDKIDGDKLDINFDPTYYTPDTSPVEVDSSEELTAHLAGIDAYFGELDGYFVGDEEHKTLRHLIHFVDDGPGGGFASGAYKEIAPVGNPWPTSEIWYVSSSKSKKIVELTIVRDNNKKPITETWEMYAPDGTNVLVTVTDTITYQGPFEISRTREIV